MKNLTLDTNCLYELELATPPPALGGILERFRRNEIALRIPAMSGSERQRGGRQIGDFGQFRDRVDRLGLHGAELLRPMAYIGLCYIDWYVLCGLSLTALEHAIHNILFPAIAFDADDHCPSSNTEGRSRWRNAKCDVQSMWCHIYYCGDIYVTRDRNFHKQTKKPCLDSLGAGVIATPEEALNAI